MKPFKWLKQQNTLRNFQKKDLRIIEQVNEDIYQLIFSELRREGWEYTNAVYSSEIHDGMNSGTFRKGNSILEMQWQSVGNALSNDSYSGSISGPERIISALARHYQQPMLAAPSWCKNTNN